MLQQTQVRTVVPYWERWMSQLPNIAALAKAKPEKVLKLWEGLGYYTRVRNLQKAAQQIVTQHRGKFPEHFEEVLALPGIGRYTAGAICSMALNQPVPILDGNVIRVLTRLFGIKGDPRNKLINTQLWTLAGDLVSVAATAGTAGDWKCSQLNQALMELGALVCTPSQPKCPFCPVRIQCVAHQTGQVERLPNLARRTPSTARRFVAFVVEDRGRFLVRQRPAGVVNAHLWEFPNIELGSNALSRNFVAADMRGRQHAGLPQSASSRRPLQLVGSRRERPLRGSLSLKRAARSVLKSTPTTLQPLCVIKHTITRYRITLEAFRVRLKHRPAKATSPNQWRTWDELKPLPFTSAHRRILEVVSSQWSVARSP